jgi:hypothetical protein
MFSLPNADGVCSAKDSQTEKEPLGVTDGSTKLDDDEQSIEMHLGSG